MSTSKSNDVQIFFNDVCISGCDHNNSANNITDGINDADLQIADSLIDNKSSFNLEYQRHQDFVISLEGVGIYAFKRAIQFLQNLAEQYEQRDGGA